MYRDCSRLVHIILQNRKKTGSPMAFQPWHLNTIKLSQIILVLQLHSDLHLIACPSVIDKKEVFLLKEMRLPL